MNETKVLVMFPSPSLRRSKALRKHKSASSLGPINFGGARHVCTGDCCNRSEGVTSPRFSYSFHLHPQLVDSQPPSDHDGDCDPMVLGTSSSSVLTRAAGNGPFEATTLYSDHPLSKEQRWREDRERPSVRIVGPLPHQCAGHETVFRTTDGKICKPLDETEFWFYKTCLREFPRYQSFVPAWHGCVLLSRKKLLLLIDSLGDDEDLSSSSSSSSSSSDEEDVEEREMEVQEHARARRSSRPTTAEAPRERSVLPSSPGTWSILLSEEFRLKLELEDNLPPSSRVSRSYPYIVLEDLTAGYDFPCTLDIKMGTKDLHHQVSTSTTMGLRIMGMQVYEPQTHTYRQFDKMQGRQLVKETVPQQLAQFVTQTLNGGPVLRREVLEIFVQKLEALLAILQQENAVQIQNSSLLLVYEGRVPPTSTNTPAMPCVKADVRMIDFQHVQLSAGVSTKPDLRSPTVLSPPTTRRPSPSSVVDSASSSSSSSAASASSSDEASVGDDMEDATTPVEQGRASDADGLAWGLRNLISLLQATLARGR